ncbi:MAG: nucleotidyltransferase domain-containing protein [Solirubrobacteraceae bacterium]
MLTQRRLDELRRSVSEIALPDRTVVALFGSWGRAELTADSDIDWALIVDDPDLDLEGPAVTQATNELRNLLEGEGKPPGGQQTFGYESGLGPVTRRFMAI